MAQQQPRSAARAGLNSALLTSLDPVEAQEAREEQQRIDEERMRAEWGLTPDAIAISEQMDRQFGDATYGEE
jgi:hypothetical protein